MELSAISYCVDVILFFSLPAVAFSSTYSPPNHHQLGSQNSSLEIPSIRTYFVAPRALQFSSSSSSSSSVALSFCACLVSSSHISQTEFISHPVEFSAKLHLEHNYNSSSATWDNDVLVSLRFVAGMFSLFWNCEDLHTLIAHFTCAAPKSSPCHVHFSPLSLNSSYSFSKLMSIFLFCVFATSSSSSYSYKRNFTDCKTSTHVTSSASSPPQLSHAHSCAESGKGRANWGLLGVAINSFVVQQRRMSWFFPQRIAKIATTCD